MPIAHPDNRTYRIFAGAMRQILRVTTRPQWQGQEHLPADGGFIAAGNHMSQFDPLPFAHFLYDAGIAPKILAKASLFKAPVLGWILRKTEQIPVYRGTADARDSLEAALEDIARGHCVVVYPEGTLTRDPDLWPMVAKTGVARLALMSRAPVVPIAQWGSQAILPQYSKRFRPLPAKPVWVRAGAPVDLSDLYDRPLDGPTLREATDRVMDAITALLADIRGEEAPAVRFDSRAPREAPGQATTTPPEDAPAPEADPK